LQPFFPSSKNSGMMFALNGEPAKQGEMMVKAMKKRD